MHEGEANSGNMTLTPRGGATKWVAAPFHPPAEMVFIGALRWVNTKDRSKDTNGTHRRRAYAKSRRDPVVSQCMSALAMELLRAH